MLKQTVIKNTIKLEYAPNFILYILALLKNAFINKYNIYRKHKLSELTSSRNFIY